MTIEVTHLTPFKDYRGTFINLYSNENGSLYWKADDISISYRNVLRGIHGDCRTEKVVACVYGIIFCAVVDPSDFTHQTFLMGDQNMLVLRIPAGFGLATLTLSDVSVWYYKQSTVYQGANKQFTIAWNDPTYAIKWPILNPILSERDRNV